MERTFIADKLDRTGEKCDSPTFDVRSICIYDLDCASETRNLAGDPRVKIIDVRKKVNRDEYGKSLIDEQNKRILKAQNKGMTKKLANHKEKVAKLQAKRRENAKKEEPIAELIAELEAEIRRMEKSITMLKEFKSENRRMKELNATVEARIYKLSRGEEISASEPEKLDVEIFLEQLDANVKSGVDYSHFKILEKDLGKDWKMGGRFSVPLCLAPISERINDAFGDITSDSSQSDCATTPCYVLFCAAIKEMDDMKLEQVDKDKILLWRDAINCAMNVQFRVDFAVKHLKKIARAYFGLKAMEWENIDGTVEKTEVPEDCLREAKYFGDKPLSTGLFH